jgi:hypothetical protein
VSGCGRPRHPDCNRLAAQRLTDGARVAFDGDYLRENAALGYAATAHAAQGVTADASFECTTATAGQTQICILTVTVVQGENITYTAIPRCDRLGWNRRLGCDCGRRVW